MGNNEPALTLTFIEPETGTFNSKERQPASYVRCEFSVDAPFERIVLRATALGAYAPYVNGNRITEQRLLPGFTDYRKRLQCQEFDITEAIQPGLNAIGFVVGDGWYRGCIGGFSKRNTYGTRTALAAAVIGYSSTSEQTILLSSSPSWHATQDGPLGINDLKMSEVYDARKDLGAWAQAGYDDSLWHTCRASSYHGSIIPTELPPVQPQETFSPLVITTPDGSTVLDFMQNISGFVRFRVHGPAGSTVRLLHGETLDKNGNFTLENLQGTGLGAKLLPVGQELIYTLKDGEQKYEPLFLQSGFRYVKLLDWPCEILPEDFQAFAAYTPSVFTGAFECSNPLINRLFEAVVWTVKSNFVDIPTDCPQRERAGWSGDINVFSESAYYLMDPRSIFQKWLEDYAGMQDAEGNLPPIAPPTPAMGAGDSSAGWADAIVTLPLMRYLFYGEMEDISRFYETARAFVELNRRRARNHHLLRTFHHGKHDDYLLDTGFHFGEWLEPGSDNAKDGLKAMLHPDYEVATAWFYYSTKHLAQMAHILDKHEDEQRYAELADRIKQAYREEFLSNGNVQSKRQCKYVRPLYMGLASDDQVLEMSDRLAELVRSNGYRIGTGFLTTYRVLQVLADTGHIDDAYRLLENEECPGWLYEIKQGATTTWEGWDAVTPNGAIKPLSMNHYAPGAVVAWLFSHCAGIKPTAPGFSEIEIKPMPGGTLTSAQATYQSVRGPIVSSWSVHQETFNLHVEIPQGVLATVILPNGTRSERHAGTYELSCSLSAR